MKSNKQRRIILTSIIAGSGTLAVLPTSWVKPVIDTVLLPAHAQTSEVTSSSAICVPCTQSVFTAVANGAQATGAGVNAVGPEGSFNTTICIDDSTTQVQMVATNNQTFGANGLEFDESLTITITRPDSTSASESYSSFQTACSGGAINVPVNSADFDISALFINDAGEFVCGDHTVIGSQCNANGRWAIRSFDLVVS